MMKDVKSHRVVQQQLQHLRCQRVLLQTFLFPSASSKEGALKWLFGLHDGKMSSFNICVSLFFQGAVR